MSVRKDSYIVRGWRLPFEPFSGKYDLLEPYMAYARKVGVRPWEFSIIFDGMSGKWVCLGEVLLATDADGDFGGNENQYVTEINTKAVSNYIVRMRKAALTFVRNNSIDVASLLHQVPTLMIVEHYAVARQHDGADRWQPSYDQTLSRRRAIHQNDPAAV